MTPTTTTGGNAMDQTAAPCEATIDLRRPIGSERRRSFQPPYYTVYRYRCPSCGAEHVMRANSFRGRNPEPSVGAIRCGAMLAS